MKLHMSQGIFNFENHRKKVCYSPESSDFESDESSLEFDEKSFRNMAKNEPLPTIKTILKTKGELVLQDLPPVEDLHFTVDPIELQKMGCFLHTIINEELNEFLVVVQSAEITYALDVDSVLFLSTGEPLGKIYEVFGNTEKRQYQVRFNNSLDIHSKNLAAAQDIYYAPANNEFTKYVYVKELQQQKGSDAAWQDDDEPPDDLIEYSDDEQEKEANQKKIDKNRKSDRILDFEEDGVSNKAKNKNVILDEEQAFQGRPRNQYRKYFPSDPSKSSYNSFSTTRVGSFQPTSAPSSQSFGSFSQSKVPFHQSIGSFSQSSGLQHQPLTAISNSNVLLPPSLATSYSTSNTQQMTPFGQSFGTFPQNRIPSSNVSSCFPQQFLMPMQSYTTSNVSSSYSVSYPQQMMLMQPFTAYNAAPVLPMITNQQIMPTHHSFRTWARNRMPSYQSSTVQNRMSAPQQMSPGYFFQNRVPTPYSPGTFTPYQSTRAPNVATSFRMSNPQQMMLSRSFGSSTS